MRCIALFVYLDENEHYRVRNEISNYLFSNYRNYENIEIPTEEGNKSILDYINYIRLPNKWSGNLEFDATNKLYNINLLILNDILDTQYIILNKLNKTIYFKPIKY